MAYQSPLHLLDGLQLVPSELTLSSLGQLRKKILAEFNLTPDYSITVGDRQYTKDEALKAIDRLKDVSNLSEHVLIFQDKPLLAWLERPTEEVFPAKAISEKRWGGNQTEFWQQTLSSALQAHCSWLLKNHLFSQAREPLAVAFALPSHHQDGILGMIYGQIHEVVVALEVAIERPSSARDSAAFGFIVYDDWADFLNSLPEYTFWGIVNEVCVNAVNYTVAVQHTQRHFVYEITHQLVRIKCDEDLKKTIRNNYAIYRDNYHLSPGAPRMSTDSEKGTRNYWLIFWVLFMLAKAALYCHR
ncbi:hypothetical protein [Spirosoma aerolatum]|uniref:hypothetical protein n=1 Tax=Spirosoma aerolatum TaxID=1211326 RepID=UPI0009AE36F2|nr:hypothetical protein [Spirosoma aerolatum]